jgi:hypothetical protein
MDVPLASVTLEGGGAEVALWLLPNATCIASEARLQGSLAAEGVVPLGDQQLPALLSEELRIRSRDVAFERALAHAARG